MRFILYLLAFLCHMQAWSYVLNLKCGYKKVDQVRISWLQRIQITRNSSIFLKSRTSGFFLLHRQTFKTIGSSSITCWQFSIFCRSFESCLIRPTYVLIKIQSVYVLIDSGHSFILPKIMEQVQNYAQFNIPLL